MLKLMLKICCPLFLVAVILCSCVIIYMFHFAHRADRFKYYTRDQVIECVVNSMESVDRELVFKEVSALLEALPNNLDRQNVTPATDSQLNIVQQNIGKRLGPYWGGYGIWRSERLGPILYFRFSNHATIFNVVFHRDYKLKPGMLDNKEIRFLEEGVLLIPGSVEVHLPCSRKSGGKSGGNSN